MRRARCLSLSCRGGALWLYGREAVPAPRCGIQIGVANAMNTPVESLAERLPGKCTIQLRAGHVLRMLAVAVAVAGAGLRAGEGARTQELPVDGYELDLEKRRIDLRFLEYLVCRLPS
jgi:hypothetical protein